MNGVGAPRLIDMKPTDAPPAQASRELGVRGTLGLMLALGTGIGAGLLAWGPVPLDEQVLRQASRRSADGQPGLLELLSLLPVAVAGCWGLRACRRADLDASVRRCWRGFFVAMVLAALGAGAYQLAPGETTYLLAHLPVSIGHALLLLGLLSERVHAQFGSQQACMAALAICLLATAPWAGAGMDLRPLWLIEMLPMLLVPVGALALPGRYTRVADGLGLLGLYALGGLARHLDASLGIGGDTLAHLATAALVMVVAMGCSRQVRGVPSARSPDADALPAAASVRGATPASRSTSLNTAVS